MLVVWACTPKPFQFGLFDVHGVSIQEQCQPTILSSSSIATAALNHLQNYWEDLLNIMYATLNGKIA